MTIAYIGNRMKSSIMATTLAGVSLVLLAAANTANAEITLLKNNNGTEYLNHLELKVGGSVRIAASHKNGADSGNFGHRGADDGTRFRFGAAYHLPDDWKLLGYYEVGNDTFNDVGWGRHVKDGSDTTIRRQLYFGFSHPTYGTLTYGKQRSVWFTTVGKTTDVWVADKKGQPAGNDMNVNANYDLGERSGRLLNYEKTLGPVDLYGEVIFPSNSYWKNDTDAHNHLVYRRNMGGALGYIYHITPDLDWGGSYTYMKGKVHQRHSDESGTDFNQQLLGTSLAWTPGNWHIAAMLGYYKDYTPLTADGRVPANAADFFHSSARSAEGFVGYTFPVATDVLTGLQPYYAISATRWSHYDQTFNYLGLKADLRYGFNLRFEHQFTNTSSTEPGANADINKVRLTLDF